MSYKNHIFVVLHPLLYKVTQL